MKAVQAILAILGRVMLCAIFLMAAVMNKIPQFSQVVEAMRGEGIPMPEVALAGAIVFLLAGGVSVVLGYKARLGALLLLVFLALATYYFHDFWNVSPENAKELQNEMAHFMKNAAMAGAMLFIIANGSGAGSLDGCCRKAVAKPS
ncbi:MAG TPA: DoxX family protein [Pirellulaceae bacterium]|nr:DoxX family protein [Pirellulaceae bacterium]